MAIDLEAIRTFIQEAKEDPKKAAPVGVVVLGVLFAIYKFGYAPQSVLLAKQLKKNKEIQGNIGKLKNAADNLDTLVVEVAEIRKKTEEIGRICFRSMEAPLFLQMIRDTAKSVGLTIRQISPQPPVSKTFEGQEYQEYAVRVSFEGDLVRLGRFLRALERQQRIVTVELPPLKPDASGTFRFDLQPTTVLVPEDFGQRVVRPEGGEGE